MQPGRMRTSAQLGWVRGRTNTRGNDVPGPSPTWGNGRGGNSAQLTRNQHVAAKAKVQNLRVLARGARPARRQERGRRP